MLASCSSTASSTPRTEKVVEFFLEREAAEAMIREVREGEHYAGLEAAPADRGGSSAETG